MGLLLLILIGDLFWMSCGFFYFKEAGVQPTLLLLYECWIIAIETIQVIVEYGVFLIDIYLDYKWDGKVEFSFYLGNKSQ